MKRLISLLLCALLIIPALAEDAPDFEPISWDIKVSPNLPNPDCYLPNNGGYHDDSIDIQINVTYWMQDLQQVDAPGEGTTTVMSARVKLTDVSQFRTGFANKYPSKQARHVNDMTSASKPSWASTATTASTMSKASSSATVRRCGCARTKAATS